jgi:hypothetical protein
MRTQRIAYARMDEPGKNRNRIAISLNRFGETSNRRPKPAQTPARIRPSRGRYRVVICYLLTPR